jgi:DNA-binding MarR family transcriptional regulator
MDEPRWLTDEQQQTWRRFVEVLVRVPAGLEAQLQRDAGLTHMGYIVLVTLSELPDRRLAMSKLAKTVSASLSRLSHVVARLEGQGWVRRERDRGDGRAWSAGLQPLGGTPDSYAASLDPHRAEIVRQDGDIMEIPEMVKLLTFYDPDDNALMFYQDLSSAHG